MNKVGMRAAMIAAALMGASPLGIPMRGGTGEPTPDLPPLPADLRRIDKAEAKRRRKSRCSNASRKAQFRGPSTDGVGEEP